MPPPHRTARSIVPLLAALPLLFGAAPLPAAPRPNVLVILADDHGIGDMSAYRHADVLTPNLDGLAARGMRFTAMRANCTVCSPTRAALLTGRFPDRAGVPGVIRTDPANSWGYLNPAVTTLPGELKKAGYHTALVGKWHLGLESPNTPNERGFDFFHGFLGDMMDSYTTHLRHGNNYLRRNGEVVSAQGHATDVFTQWATDYLAERARAPGQPFFLLLAYNAPHFPIEPPGEWLDRVKRRAPHLDGRRARNVALVEHLDDAVGRVLRALDEFNLSGDTLVVYTSDNGGSLPHAQNNEPWRGGKQDMYDGGLRVPFVVRWPQRVTPNTVCDYPGLVFDVFATCVELAGLPPVPGTDAVSLAPLLEGKRLDGERELYFVRREGGAYGGKAYHAVIRGPWKLMQNEPFSKLELYNLADDPAEQHNLAASNPRVAKDLLAALRTHLQRGGGVPWQKAD